MCYAGLLVSFHLGIQQALLPQLSSPRLAVRKRAIIAIGNWSLFSLCLCPPLLGRAAETLGFFLLSIRASDRLFCFCDIYVVSGGFSPNFCQSCILLSTVMNWLGFELKRWKIITKYAQNTIFEGCLCYIYSMHFPKFCLQCILTKQWTIVFVVRRSKMVGCILSSVLSVLNSYCLAN